MRLLVLLLLLLGLTGCGAGPGGGAARPPLARETAPGVLVLRQGTLPPGVTELRFRGRDADGVRVFGPSARPPAGEVRLEGVPVETVEILVELRQGSEVVALLDAPVNLATGQALLQDLPLVQPTGLQVVPATARHPLGLALPARALGLRAEGPPLDLTDVVRWSATGGARVDAEGRVEGVAPGAASLTASLGALADFATVAVTSDAIARLQVDPPAASVPVGLPVRFRATAFLEDGTALDVSAAAAWSPARTVIPGTAGETAVTATLRDASAHATLTGRDTRLVGLGLLPGGGTLPAGTTRQLQVWGYFADGTSHDLTRRVAWSSDTPEVAQVSGAGLARGRSAGAATLSASLGALESSTPVTVQSVTLVALELQPDSLELPRGVMRQVRALGRFSDGTTRDLTNEVTWSSWNPAAASVSVGLVTSNAPGWATIAAAWGSGQGRCEVTTTGAALASLDLEPGSAVMAPGQYLPLRAWGTFSDGSVHDVNRNVTWSSDRQDVALVGIDPDGSVLVTSVAPGEARVSARHATGVEQAAAVTVSAAPLASLHLGPRGATGPVGTSLPLTATAEYLDGAYRDVSRNVDWVSEDPDVAVVAPGGRVSVVAPGTAVLRATDRATGTSETLQLQATAATLQRLRMAPEAPRPWPGQAFQAWVVGEFSDGTQVDLTDAALWTSSDGAVVGLDERPGAARCRAVGTAELRASVPDLGATAATTVVVGARRPAVERIPLLSVDGVTPLPTQDAQPSGDGTTVLFRSYTVFEQAVGVFDRLTGTTTVLTDRRGLRFSGSPQAISEDGRYLVVSSDSPDLGPADADTAFDVYVFDRVLGPVRKVSLSSEGLDTSQTSWMAGISGDGRYVGFVTDGGLFPGDSNGMPDTYVHDLRTGLTRWVSRGYRNTLGQGDWSSGSRPTLSRDGRFVAYDSGFSNLVPEDTSTDLDVFVFDTASGRNRLASRNADGSDLRGWAPALSADGAFVAFQDRVQGGDRVIRVDLRSGGVDFPGGVADEGCTRASLSADGSVVAFLTAASNLLPPKSSKYTEAYVRGTALRWGSPGRGGQRPLANVNAPSLASGGGILTFDSTSTVFVAGDDDGLNSAFVLDLASPPVVPVENPRAPIRLNPTPTGGLSAATALPESVTADGSLVVFTSSASDLVAGDTNGVTDMFLRDMATGAITRPLPVQPDGACSGPRLTPDGRWLVFTSTASNLGPAVVAGRQHVYLLDRDTGQVHLLSRTADGQEGDAASGGASLSDDGRYVEFGTQATNLGGPPGTKVLDRLDGSFTTVDVPPGGQAGVGFGAALTGDGRKVVFVASNATLVPDDTNGKTDLFLRDLDSGILERVSLGTGGVQGDGSVTLRDGDASASRDGRYVYFQSYAANLVPFDTNAMEDAFVRDRLTGTTVRVSVGPGETQANDWVDGWGMVSADGRFAIFVSDSTNLDPQGIGGVFVHELAGRRTRCVSRTGEDATALGRYYRKPLLSADSRFVLLGASSAVLLPRRSPTTGDPIYDPIRLWNVLLGGYHEG